MRPWLEHRDRFESCTDAHDVAWQGERMNGAGVLTGADVACQDGYTNYIGALVGHDVAGLLLCSCERYGQPCHICCKWVGHLWCGDYGQKAYQNLTACLWVPVPSIWSVAILPPEPILLPGLGHNGVVHCWCYVENCFF